MPEETIAQQLDRGAARMDDLQHQIDALDKAIAANTDLTQKIHDSTSGLVEAFDALRGGLRVLEQIGRVARPLSYIVGFATAAWGFFQLLKAGGSPK